MPSLIRGARLAVVSVVICSALLTVRSRFALVGDSRPYSWAFPDKATGAAAAAATLAAASPPPPPPPPAAASTSAARGAAACATPSSAAQPTTGWKRTLPADVYRCATWFARERTLEQIYADVPVGGTVWLTFANWAFRDLALNWAAHAYRLGVERSVAIAALDTPFQGLLRAEALPYFGFDHGMTGDLRSNVSGFRRLGALKGTLVLSVLRANRGVLLSDVDVVWLADPRPILRGLSSADVMAATDCLHVSDDERKWPPRPKGTNRCAYNPGNSDGHAAFNTGVVYFGPSAAVCARHARTCAPCMYTQHVHPHVYATCIAHLHTGQGLRGRVALAAHLGRAVGVARRPGARNQRAITMPPACPPHATTMPSPRPSVRVLRVRVVRMRRRDLGVTSA